MAAETASPAAQTSEPIKLASIDGSWSGIANVSSDLAQYGVDATSGTRCTAAVNLPSVCIWRARSGRKLTAISPV
jgi:hypothetical protein